MPADQPSPTVPPASFANLVLMLASQAAIALGQAPNPVSGKTEKQLEVARHLIDTLAILDEKTKGNLAPDEAQLLETAIHQLRLGFVEAQRQS
jgi:ABC-type branched-subunit amino acid transport system ATPase component